jgi:hypothetical protein
MKINGLDIRFLARFALSELKIEMAVEAVERCGKGEGRIPLR